MTSVVHLVAAVAIGGCLALQPPINAVMARTLGSPLLASVISIAISLVVVVPAWLVVGQGAGDFAQVRALPWWVVLGGVIGVVVVAGSVLVAPTLGIAFFFVCVVAGQLGAFGLPTKPVDLMKVVGIGLVLLGAALVQRSGR
jgi:transporter family-2 protein